MNKFFGRAFIIFLSMTMIFVFSSCEKKPEETKNEEVLSEVDEKSEEQKQPEPVMETVEGVVYVDKASLYTETSEGTMKWAGEISLGDVAVYLGEKKNAKRTDNQERTFFHISFNDKDYWIQDYCYEPNTVLAFISSDDVILYKSDSLTAVTDEFIPKYFMVAVYKDSLEDSNNTFLKIASYCPELYISWIVKDKFVKRDFVELDKVSVDAITLAQIAMESDNETIRGELFRNAIEINSKYSADIMELENLTNIKQKEEEFLKELEVEKTNKKVLALNDVSLLSIPNENTGRHVADIKKDDVLNASKQVIIVTDTTNEDSVNEVTWLYVQTKQKRGWINAMFVEEK